MIAGIRKLKKINDQGLHNWKTIFDTLGKDECFFSEQIILENQLLEF